MRITDRFTRRVMLSLGLLAVIDGGDGRFVWRGSGRLRTGGR